MGKKSIVVPIPAAEESGHTTAQVDQVIAEIKKRMDNINGAPDLEREGRVAKVAVWNKVAEVLNNGPAARMRDIEQGMLTLGETSVFFVQGDGQLFVSWNG